MYFVLSAFNKEVDDYVDKEEKRQAEYATETEKESDNSQKSSDFQDGIQEFGRNSYAYITNSDLDKYGSNMEGVKIYVVTNIDDMKDNSIQSNMSDGFMMSSFHVSNDNIYSKYEDILKEDDTVAILGTVSDVTSYGFAGKSYDINNCLVFAVGSDAEQYRKDSSDESLSDYFVVTEDVANLNDDVSESDYKNLCEYYDYNDILRNPDSYKKKYCRIDGTVDQIMEGWFGSYTIYLMDDNGNKWGCTYSYKDGESHVLEGDYISVYGMLNGTETVTTVLGAQVTLPYVDLEYIN